MIHASPTLIFIGLEDRRVLPETQGIPLYKAMRSQKINPISLYHYSKEGHIIKARINYGYGQERFFLGLIYL